MSKKGRYIGGHTVVSRKSSFFQSSKKDEYLSQKEVKKINEERKLQNRILRDKTQKLIATCIQNIKLSKSPNSPYKKNSNEAIHHFLREIIRLLFNKTQLGLRKEYSATILKRLANLGIKKKMIKEHFNKYANNKIMSEMKKSFYRSSFTAFIEKQRLNRD